MNVTLALPGRLLDRARTVARRQGTSVNALIRRYLEGLAGIAPGEAAADEILSLMRRRPGRSGGRRIRRSDLYEDRA